MICITTQGTAYERGFQQGSQTAPIIRQVHARYGDMSDLNPVSILRQMESRFPELILEMEGIADGCGISKDQIFRMNLMPLGAAPACSTVGIRDQNKEIWIAKTDDIALCELGWNILRKDIPESGAASLHLHFAGTIWTSSASSSTGFCMAMTGLAGDPGPSAGIPPQVLWRVLSDRCTTAWEAIALLESCTLSTSGMSLLLADANQTLLMVEKTSAGQCFKELDAASIGLCHTNHTCMDELKDPPGFIETALGKNSRERLNHLKELLYRQPRSREGLQSLLADHDLHGAVCQHGEAGLHTDYAVILSPGSGGIWLSKGPPCREPFEFIGNTKNP